MPEYALCNVIAHNALGLGTIVLLASPLHHIPYRTENMRVIRSTIACTC